MTQLPSPAYCPACAATVASDAAYCGHCGTRQPGRHLAPRLTPAGAPAHPPRRLRSSRSLVLIGAAIGLLVLAAIPLLILSARPASPEDAVRSYFEALADRDADEARALLDASADEQTEPPMLTRAMLRSSGYTPPTDAHFQVLNSLTDSAAVRVRYEVAGATREIELTLVLGDDSRRSHGWRIQNGLMPLSLPAGASPGDRLFVAGTPVPATRQTLEAVFPGAYLIALGEHPLREAPPITTPAGGGSPDRFQVRLRPTVRHAIEPQVRAYLDRCATSTELAPPGCPFRGISTRPVTNVAWKVTQYPALDVQLTSGGDAWVTSTTGAAEATGRTDIQAAPAFAYSTSFSVSGTSRVADGKIVFEPTR